MTSPFSYHEDFLFTPLENQRQFTGTPQINASQTPQASYRPLPDRTTDEMSYDSPAPYLQTQLEPDRLRFLELNKWDELNSYEEEVPSLLHYSIEWKVAVNNRVVAKDTEQDLVLVPIAYWHMVLQPKLEKLLQKKLGPNRHVRCDDTELKVSISDRTQRDLVKRFDDLDISWPIIAKQLEAWGERFRSGKKLRVDLCFNYVDAYPSSATPKRGTKRGSSATQKMLAERAAQLEAEDDTDGNSSIWREIYTMMRCPGAPCDLGPHCWRDPYGKKHYKLRTPHLKALIEYVKQGNVIKSHEDVPAHIQEQLFAEERQRLDRQPKSTSSIPTPYPPITITNVMPQSYQSPSANSTEATPPATVLPAAVPLSTNANLEIPGPRDLAVKVYSEWQQSNVIDETLKAEFRRACEVTLQDGLDLEQVYGDQNVAFFIKSGIKPGIARRFISDIERWVKRYKVSCEGDVMM